MNKLMRLMAYSYRALSFLFLLLLHLQGAVAAPMCRVTRYDENNGLSQWRVTQMLQDHNGVIWFATWNGLNRFDGYDFKCFKVSDERECQKTDDRIRNIWLSDEGHIYCKSDEGYYYFDTGTYTFHDVPDEENEAMYGKLLPKHRGGRIDYSANGDLSHTDANGYEWTLTRDGHLYYKDKSTGLQVEYPLDVPTQDLRFYYPDKQGNLWILFTGGVYKFTFTDNSIIPLPEEHPTHVRCIFVDHKMRYWVTGRDDYSVRIYSPDNRLSGYLGKDGRIHPTFTPFTASVYCIMQDSRGDIWMGCKPGGLFRLKEKSEGEFNMTQLQHNPTLPYSLSHNDVYDIKEDAWGRLWIATLGGGINCLTNPESDSPKFVHKENEMKGYPTELCRKVRYLHLTTDGIMLAATTEGLLATQLPDKENGAYDRMEFRHHVKRADSSNSLSCSAIMDILQDSHGKIFISTENGGISQLITEDLLADTLAFKRFNTSNGLPSDVTLMMTEHEGSLWVVCANQICVINPYEGITNSFDSNFFGRYYRFSEARPTRLPDGRWMFGLHDGAFTLNTEKMRKSEFTPLIILTDIFVQNQRADMQLCNRDTLILMPDERNLTVHFAAIEYTNADRINYAFRLDKEEKEEASPWNNIGKSRSATFLDLRPGEYMLSICSTNADGVWVDNTRTIRLIVTPTFWETGWATLLYLSVAFVIASGIIYTCLYIKRINRKHKETLEAYLALLNQPGTSVPHEQAPATMPEVNKEEELFMRQIMDFVEANMSNPDINIGDMAEAVHISRSGLNRKMKSALGMTPLDLLREARIKRACQLLESGELNVSEVAYHCGFADPKYFSRCFKQTMGVSPTEYKRK